MRKIFLLLAIVLMNFIMVKAQVLTIDPASQQVTIDASGYVEATSNVTNISSITRNFKWVLFVDDQPAGWTFSVCDNNTCYAPGATKPAMAVALTPNQSSLLRLNLWANGITGSGSYHIVFYDLIDSANANITMYIGAVADLTGIGEPNSEIISLYPNPVKTTLFINLTPEKHITSIDIHNLVGQKIKTVIVEDGLKKITVSVADLKKGIYFLRAFTNGKEVATMTFSKD
ncbi:MAG TPA: T9SS type A sorting domain-containing protein [Chitinophagales bacterium]|nr:T9SS type A sorting domain-containing protein [Chitinophagales bacterium]